MDYRERVIPPLYLELAKTLQGSLDASQETLTAHSTDYSPYVITPHLVTFPKTVDDIRNILRCAFEHHIPVALRGAGTSTTGASLVEGIVIDTSVYFNTIRHIDPLAHIITVDPGVTCKKIREALAGWGMEIPFLTSQDDDATIGGVVANKSVSEASFQHGGIQSWILGLSVILPNGEQHVLEDAVTPSGALLAIYQALFPLLSDNGPFLRGNKPSSSEDASGYNIWTQHIGPRQLISTIIGSQGTLAIISQIKLRIVPKKEFRIILAIRVPHHKDIPTVVALCKTHAVDGLFMYDIFLEKIHTEQPSDTRETDTFIILATLLGTSNQEVQERRKRLERALGTYTSTLIEQEDYQDLTQHDHVLHRLHTYTKGTLTPVVTGGGLLFPEEKLGEALDMIEAYHVRKNYMYTITGNVGSGHLSIITLIPPHVATFSDDVTEATKALCLIARQLSGNISAASGDGLTGTPYLPLFYSQKIMKIFEQVKAIFDPHAILNPGRKTTLTTDYTRPRIRVPLQNEH